MNTSKGAIMAMIESSSTLKYHQYDKILFQKYVMWSRNDSSSFGTFMIEIKSLFEAIKTLQLSKRLKKES